MAGFTNRGKNLLLKAFFNTSAPTNIYAALVTSAVAPSADTNTLGELTEIANGNGYTAGGMQLARNATDFPSLAENDATDIANILVKNLVWTAATGNLPASGNGARYCVLVDDNATPANRQVIAWFDLTADRTVSVGQSLTVQNAELRLTE
jgi:hypothetical protein